MNQPRRRFTVTRSISLDPVLFAALEKRRSELRMDRSEFITALLEDELGFMPHPEVRDKARKAVVEVEGGYSSARSGVVAADSAVRVSAGNRRLR